MFKPYALIGYTKTKRTLTIAFLADSPTFDFTEEDLSYAIGVEFELNEDFVFNLDYSQLIDNSRIDMNSINFGVKYAF